MDASEDGNTTTLSKDLSIIKAGIVSCGPSIAINGLQISKSSIIKLNISGRKFHLRRETLLKYPSTRLGRIALGKRTSFTGKTKDVACIDLYDHLEESTKEFFFEKNPDVFPYIITYYSTGKLHLPRHICAELFQMEAEYWGIPFSLDCCCQGYHQQEWESTETVRKTNILFEDKRRKNKSVHSLGSVIDLNPETKWVRIKRKTWALFEDHESSRAASIISLVSSAMVIISTITLCLNTHPDIQNRLSDGTKTDNPYLAVVEMVCICWFTIEYTVRLIACPKKVVFLKSGLNTIDLLAILPFYIGLFIQILDGDVNSRFTDVRRFVQILRIFRIVRIFKVARHSAGLQVLAYTVRNSLSELGLLVLLLLMGMTLFSCLIYYAEVNVKDTKFTSIIAACWWSIITMTTVGYGDMYPETTMGQIIGSMCCVSGILFIALPIPTIVSNFSAFYKDHLNKEKLSKLYGIHLEDSNTNITTHLDDEESESIVSIGDARRLSLSKLERHEYYRRRMSTASRTLSSFSSSTPNKIFPAAIEEEV